MSLLLVQADGEWFPVKRRGVFTVERALTRDPDHLRAAVTTYLERFIALQTLMGLEPLGTPPEIGAIEEHRWVSDDAAPDLGPEDEPRLHQFLTAESYVAAAERYEQRIKEQTARVARRGGETPDLVDVPLIVAFRKRRARTFTPAARLAGFAGR